MDVATTPPFLYTSRHTTGRHRLEELRRMREEAGLSQAQLARESGVDRATINKIEQGKRSPSIATLESLSRTLAVEMADFFPKAQAPLPDLEEERREPEPPEPPEAEQIHDLRSWTTFFPGLEGGPDLKAAFWIECLNTQADLCERIIARGGYDLETMWDLEGATIELWGAYSKTVRKLVHQWRTPGQADALQRAEDRMKAARTAARRAYQERRDAEEDRQKVVDLDARRRLREARYTDQGYANAGT